LITLIFDRFFLILINLNSAQRHFCNQASFDDLGFPGLVVTLTQSSLAKGRV
jgi:hypothetical protein